MTHFYINIDNVKYRCLIPFSNSVFFNVVYAVVCDKTSTRLTL